MLINAAKAIRSYFPDVNALSAWRKYLAEPSLLEQTLAVLYHLYLGTGVVFCSLRKEPLPGASNTTIFRFCGFDRDHFPFVPAASHSAVACSRRDDPRWLLQAIDGVRNGDAVSIGYHVPGVIYEMQI